MILLRRFVPLLCFLVAGTLAAQTPSPASTGTTTAIFADEHDARLAERYKAMLAANPVEGLALDRLWKSHEEAGATAQLIEEYRRAADAARNDPIPSLLYGYFLKKAGRLDDAAAAYDRAATIQPSNPLPTLARAELALARSRPAEAATQFETALSLLPASDRRRAELLLKTGDAWQAAGQPLKAADAWEKTVALAPTDLAMHRRLAANYEKNALPERAIGHYEYIESHADPAGCANALRELGRLHETRGEFDAARDALERGLALISRDNWLYGDLQTRLIRLYQRAGRVPELEARWRKAVEQAPRDLGGYARLESLAEAQGDPTGERTWLERIVALSPRDRDSTLKLARLLADNGERERAAAAYDKLLQSQPGNLDLVLARADLDVQLGLPDAAASRVEARLAQSPTDESIAAPALEFFLDHHLNSASEKFLRAQVVRQPSSTEPSLALAKFLFSERRVDEARRVLDELSKQVGEPFIRAARWMAIADSYKEQNLADDALHCFQTAAALQPAATAPLFAASELLLARGDAKGAVEPLQRALDATPAGPEHVEVEHKLFQIIQAAGTGARIERPADELSWTRVPSSSFGPSAPVTISLGTVRPVGGAASTVARVGEPLGQYISNLRKIADDQPTSEHFLRLARWQSWAGQINDAANAAEKVIALDPANIPARELLVSISIDTHRHDVAETRLREIMALDPSRQAVCLRQIASLEAEDNEIDEALAIYEDLQKAAPGSVEALSDLALTQQRADRWYDALATWERAEALPGLTPAQRADMRRPLLAAYERLDQFPRAAELLQSAVDAQTDLTAREGTFRELAAFCHKHDLGEWLEKQYRTRLAAQPNDYFTLIGMAALSKDAGREREAYQFLGRAYYSSPDPVSSLRGLADAAESLGENEEAISHQRRLTALPGQATAENLEKLAGLQGDNLDTDAAARTWDQIAAKFPRDPNYLERGANFFENAGKPGRARELFRQVIALNGNNPRQLFHLARLDIDAGDTAAARELLEQSLARTDPEKPGDPLFPPPDLDFSPSAVSSLIAGLTGRRARDLGLVAPTSPAEPDERHLRLDAIRELSRLLLANGSDTERQKWLDRWTAAATAGLRSEPLAALFFSGEKARTMTLVTGWMNAGPADDRIRNAFLAAGLRLGEYGALAQWAWHDADLTHKAERGQWLLGALQQYLNSGGKPGPGIVTGLFPTDVKLRETLWEAASNAFAERHWYAQAAELGTRVYALVPSNRSEYALKIAQWELYIGNIAHAKAVLRDAVESDRGESFEVSGNTVFAALRIYDRLLPENERAEFTEEYLQRMRDHGELAQATLAGILLHGLAGDERAAEGELDDLIGMRLLSTMMGGGTPDARRWNYVLNNGVQLLAWNLDTLAAYYWRHALKEASAFERQDGDAINFQSEIRGRLLGVEVAMATDPQQARERVEDYLRAGPTWEAMAMEAGQLLAASQFPAAARFYETLCRARPGDAESWRNLLVAYESAGDQGALERTVNLLLANATPLPAGLSRFDLVSGLANRRQAEGDAGGACRLLEYARLAMPGVQGVMIQLAQAYEQAGRWDQAVRVWSDVVPTDPSGNARLSLAAANERMGRPVEAIALLNDCLRSTPEPSRTNAAIQLARLYLSAKQWEEVRALATRLLQEGPAKAIPPVAEIIAQAGQRPFARELLTTAVRRSHDIHLRYSAQEALAAQYTVAEEDLAAFTREMHRLEMFARGDAGLHNAFVLARYRLARQRGADAWLEGELKSEWDDSRGEVAAGEKLASLYLETNRDDGLRDVITAIDRHPDLPEQTLHTLEAQLVQARRGPLALPMLERLHRRFPQNEGYVLDQARALWQTDRHEEAIKVLDAFDAATVFRDDLVGQTGMVYLELGDKVRARQNFETVARHDFPVVHFPQIALSLARLDREDHRLSTARRWLRLAYRNPTCADLTPLVDDLTATGQFEGDAAARAMPGGEIPLTFSRRAQLMTAVYERLKASGLPSEARRWVGSHSELLAGAPGLIAEMRRTAAPSDLPVLAMLIEGVVRQAEPPVPRLERELAALYMQWVGVEGADSVGMIDHLARAHALKPDDFDIAQKLARAYLAQKQDELAASALAGFLDVDALPDERKRAQQTLSRLPM